MAEYDEMRKAVAEGVKDALHDPSIMNEFWQNAFVRLQQDSTDYAKAFLWDRFKAMIGKAISFFIIGMLIYSVGVWASSPRT